MSVVFFTDRDLGKQFPLILRAAGLAVEAHADYFAPAAKDEEWLEESAKRGWVAVTHDRRIRYKPNELAAVIAHRAALLVVVGHAPFADLARAFVTTAPRIVTFLERHDRPLIAKVYRPRPADLAKDPTVGGHVELWYPGS